MTLVQTWLHWWPTPLVLTVLLFSVARWADPVRRHPVTGSFDEAAEYAIYAVCLYVGALGGSLLAWTLWACQP